MASLYDSTPPQTGRHGYVVVNGSRPDTYVIARNCPFCGQGAQVTVPGPALWKWEREGALLQVAFPMLSIDEREMVHTGIHPACWDSAMGDPDE